MSNEISNQNIAGLQDELLRNISSIKQKISEWLERPQVGGVEPLYDAISEIKNILLLLGKAEAAELGDEIIAVIAALQESVHDAGDNKPANFDRAGAEVASAILILDDYIEHLSDKRDNRHHIAEILHVMRSIKEDVTSSASYTAQPHISKDTYQILAGKVSEIIGDSRTQIEQHRRDSSNSLNADAIIGHNKELINIFAVLNLAEPQFLLQKINYILTGQPSESEWVDMAEAMILVEETLRKTQFDSSSVSSYDEALARQIRHSRSLEVNHLLRNTGEAGLQFFEVLRKKVVEEELVHSGQGWRKAASRLAHYSTIAELVDLTSLASALRGMGKVYTAISLQNNISSTAYPAIIDSLVGIEYIFSDLSENNRPSEQDIAFLKEAVMQIAGYIPVTAEIEQQFAGFINASEADISEEHEDLSGTFGNILNDSLTALDRFGAPMELETLPVEDNADEAVQLSPSMVHVASIKEVIPNNQITGLDNVTIQSNIRHASEEENAIPVSPASAPPSVQLPEEAALADIALSETVDSPVTPITQPVAADEIASANASLTSNSPQTSEFKDTSVSLDSSKSETIQFIPFFQNKALADLDHLQIPADKQNFVTAHADAVMDDEIREFFGEEFAELLELLNEAYPKWQAEPDSQNLTTDIRRAFHTLKGSGRTVGYESLGEFAWQHEQLLNRVLDNHYRANALVQSTVGDAIDLLNILKRQDEFAEHQGALLQQAAAAEAVREALMQDSELGETIQSFASASLQWRLHDKNLTINPTAQDQSIEAVMPGMQVQQADSDLQSGKTDFPLPNSTQSDFSDSQASVLSDDTQSFGNYSTLEKSSADGQEPENTDELLSSFELLPKEQVQTADTDILQKSGIDSIEPAKDGQDTEQADEWIPPFELAPQNDESAATEIAVTMQSEVQQSSSHQDADESLPFEVDFTWAHASEDSASDIEQVEQNVENLFDFMSGEDWQKASAEQNDTTNPQTETPSFFEDSAPQKIDAEQMQPASARVPDELATSDIFADDARTVDSVLVEALPDSDARIVSKVARTLEKGLAHESTDEAVQQAMQATLQRQLNDELLSDPARIAALAKAVQHEMANNDAAMLHQVQSIFAQMQAQSDPLLRTSSSEPAPIDPRAEQIVRMLEKGLANSSDNPALTAALETTLQNKLSNEVLGDSNKLDALLAEISATLAAFPTITEDTAEDDEFQASVEQISQSIELGLSLGELSAGDKDALVAAIRQELLYPPASEQDSEQLKAAVENRLQEKQILPASDIREVLQKAFTGRIASTRTSPNFSPDIPTDSSVQADGQDKALMSDFSWPDVADHAAAPADTLHALDKAAFNTLQKTLNKALAGGSVDSTVAAGISMALARQWQQNNLPVDDASFANIAEQLRHSSPHHEVQDMDNILQALAKRLGVTASQEKAAVSPNTENTLHLDEIASFLKDATSENQNSSSIATLQKTLDKALRDGVVDEAVVTGIGMTLAHQWQHHHLPHDAETFADIAGQLRNNSQQYDPQNIDRILQNLAGRLGISAQSATEQNTADNRQWADVALSDLAFAEQVRPSLATLQKTLDKALHGGAVDDSVAAGIGMALARQWQQNHLPVSDEAFAQIAAQLRKDNRQHNSHDLDNILNALAGRLGVAAASPSHTAAFTDYSADEQPDIADATTASFFPESAAIQDWQALPSLEEASDEPPAQTRQESFPTPDLTDKEALPGHEIPVSSEKADGDETVTQDWQALPASDISRAETQAAFAIPAEEAPSLSAEIAAGSVEDFAFVENASETPEDNAVRHSDTDSESFRDVENHTPEVDGQSSSVMQTAHFSPVESGNGQDSVHVAFDLSRSNTQTGNTAPATHASSGWTNSMEYVRPSISMKSSAASLRLSRELEQLAQHPTLDDAVIRHTPGASEETGADEAVFLHAVDRFETLSHQIEDSSDPDTINELIESVYDIEDSIESDSAPEWMWRMLDSVEQLLLMYKYQGANVSAGAASILRQSAHLIEHHREQDNEEEALENINALIAARQERSRISAEQQDHAASPSYPAIDTGYGEELVTDPNANTFLAETFLDEAMTLFGRSQLDAERWDEDLSRLGILDRIRRDMHTLKGSSRMAGYMAIGDLTHAVESLIDSILDGYSKASSRAAAILSGAMWQGMLMLDTIRDGYLPQTDPYILNNISEYLNQPLPYPEVAEREKLAKAQQRQEAEEAQFRPVETPAAAVPAAASSQAAAPQPAIPQQQAPAEEAPAQEAAAETFGEGFDGDIDPVLVSIFTDEAEELLSTAEHYLEEDLTSAAIAEEFKRTMHTLKGSSRLVGLSAMGDTSHLMESVMEKMPELTGEQIEQARILLQGGYESLRVMLDAALRQEMPKPAKGVNRVLELFVREGKFEWPPSPEEDKEEAQSQSAPPKAESAAQEAPASGALPDPAAESAASAADNAQVPAEPAHPSAAAAQAPAGTTPSPAAATPPAEHTPASTASSAASGSAGSNIPQPVEAPVADSVAPEPVWQPPVEEPSAPESAPEAKKDEDADRGADKAPDVSRFVRVDAQLLDEIIAMVGEASIMRSRMENIAGGVEFSLGELTRISTRIAEQMRRLDNETEAQMLFRREQQGSDDEHFDPLEMDRFTEIQQLSRQLSEAIDDLKNVQDTLANDNTVLRNLASQQGIIQRSLQDRLLSTQLMRFDVNEPRLKRLVRQTARTVGKDVQFVLEGGQVELERRLLEDVLPALEHMIRNSIAHGIELPAQRRAAGKPEIGTIKLVVAVQASEVIMRLIDDGQGFDYDRIRSKAREKGYLDEALANDKQYLNSLILRSGFSTAQSLTQISGRGVGMDVVNEMVKQRRGRLGADSLPGKGTEFTIVMPFSMSISEVLLVDIGGRTYAAPMSSITAVSQVSRSDLQDSIDSDTPVYHHYDERDYRLYVLGRYFEPGNYEFSPEAAQLPALFVDSGDEAAAFHVDRILNRLEIIVKNVNRQVLNIPGISGATILGDASVVPVLELMDLARRIGSIVPDREVEAAPESTEKRILVVDDSVTMRKVSTRLLERNHFIVETAKDGLDAIDVLQNFKPDLIMLDIEMPRMDGFEFATHVRQNSDVPNVPIVMVTSRTGDKHRERAGQIGVQGYLGKPYREDILMETLNSLLGDGGLS